MKKYVKTLVLLLILLFLGACDQGPATAQVGEGAGKAPAMEESVPEGAYTAEDVAEMFDKPPAAEASTAPDAPAFTLELPADLLEGVVHGRSVCIHPNGVAFWGAEETLCSALVDGEGNLYDPCVEIELPHYIWSIAMVDDNMYLATDGGFYCLNLTEFSSGSTVMDQISETVMFNGFSIYQNCIYYFREGNLCRFPLDSGVEEILVEDLEDYEVTAGGIFYTTAGTGLYLLPHDPGEPVLLGDTEPEASFTISGTDLYHWSGDTAYVFRVDLATGTAEKLSLDHQRYATENVWVLDDRILYTDSAEDVCAHDLNDQHEWALDNLYVLPNEHDALIQGDMMYYRYAETVYWVHMRYDERGSIGLSEFAGSGAAAETVVPEPDATTSATAEAPPADYMISSGLNLYQDGDMAIVETDHFTMSLPADISWSLEIVDNDTIRFFHSQAYLEGYGGTFLTIHALDAGDESYLDWPDYSTLGTSNGKQYIATRPTDVQYNTADPVQGEEYGDLLFHARLFYEFELDNPFHLK